MRNPLSDKITTIKPSGIRKFFDLVSEMKDAISLGVGEPDFDTPWRIREEGIYTLEKGKTYYTSNSGLMDLRIEISRYLERRFGLNYDAEKEIIVTVGGSEGIDLAFRAMLNPGDEVIIPEPCYVSYVPCVKHPFSFKIKFSISLFLLFQQLYKAVCVRLFCDNLFWVCSGIQ